nr:unnamed protein product [Callosobruchus chinensis]CAH7767712.1 unnamed protein product [Callosobruchus chinensis]
MANKFHEFKHKLDASLRDSSKPWTSILDKAEKKSGVDRLYIFLASAVVVGLWLVFGYCAQLLCNTVGFIYPAYVSIRAIESRAKDDDTKWLTYWVVYAIFSILEYFANAIVNWFPLYWLTKCIFLIWLMIPTEFNGSLLLYNKVIKPYFLKHHKTIDETVGKVKDTATKIFDKHE